MLIVSERIQKTDRKLYDSQGALGTQKRSPSPPADQAEEGGLGKLVEETDPLIRGDRALSSSGELVRTPAAPPPSDAGCLRKATRPLSGARPPTAHARSRMLPALPRAQALHRRRPRSLVLRARGLRCCAGPVEAVAGAGMSYRRMLQRGARRPPQSTRARIPQKFGSGSVGSEMQPKHRFTEPRANKHAQALTQTSPRPALAAADPGRGRPRKSPGPGRGRCLRLKVQGVAARDRPLKGLNWPRIICPLPSASAALSPLAARTSGLSFPLLPWLSGSGPGPCRLRSRIRKLGRAAWAAAKQSLAVSA
nr:uncharacterized protein LOC132596848 [Globicephala melas]